MNVWFRDKYGTHLKIIGKVKNNKNFGKLNFVVIFRATNYLKFLLFVTGKKHGIVGNYNRFRSTVKTFVTPLLHDHDESLHTNCKQFSLMVLYYKNFKNKFSPFLFSKSFLKITKTIQCKSFPVIPFLAITHFLCSDAT